MVAKKLNGALCGMLVLAVFLWGGSNVGTKFLVQTWPPIWIGSTRLLCAGLILLAILRWTKWLGTTTPLSAKVTRDLWFRGGLSLAVYIVVFILALKYTSASHVALYLGAAPVWGLLWEERPSRNWRSAQRYAAASLAVSGVIVLNWPSLRSGTGGWLGELLGLAASLLWTTYGLQGRALGATLSGVAVSAHTMWRAGAILLPLALWEIAVRGLVWRTDYVLVQTYCLIAGGVVAYALWNTALKHWPTSQVLLFNNLIPLCTMAWARVCLKEPFTGAFWLAMILIVLGVILGQGRWAKFARARSVPSEKALPINPN